MKCKAMEPDELYCGRRGPKAKIWILQHLENKREGEEEETEKQRQRAGRNPEGGDAAAKRGWIFKGQLCQIVLKDGEA